MAPSTIKLTLDTNGIEQVAGIIAHLKTENDTLKKQLAAVQEASDRLLRDVQRFQKADLSSPPPHCVCGWCEQKRNEKKRRGGYAGADQE